MFQPAITCSKLTIETIEQRCERCSTLTKKPLKRRQWRRFVGFIVNFEHILHLCSSVSIVNFEQVNAGWIMMELSCRNSQRLKADYFYKNALSSIFGRVLNTFLKPLISVLLFNLLYCSFRGFCSPLCNSSGGSTFKWATEKRNGLVSEAVLRRCS